MMLEPQNPDHRRYAIQERFAKLQRDGMTSLEAWQTMNSEPDMQPFLAAQDASESEEQNVAAAIKDTLRGQMVGMALIYVDKALATLNLKGAQAAILRGPLLRPIANFQTPNGAPASGVDATLDSLAVDCTAQILRAALDGAIYALSTFLPAEDAPREVYADPLFAPLVAWLADTTGEDLRTGNSAIIGHALNHFIKGAIGRHGLAVLRGLTERNPSFAQFSKFLKGDATSNGTADLSTPQGRAAAVQALVSKQREQFGEDYDGAFARVCADSGNAALFAAMRKPIAAI